VAVDEGMNEELGTKEEERGASVVVEASTDETAGVELDTDNDVVEVSGSGTAEETIISEDVEEESEEINSDEVETEISEDVEDESEEITSDEVETEITLEESRTEESVEETLGLHLPGRAEAEARKRGKSDRSRTVERVGAIVMTAKLRKTLRRRQKSNVKKSDWWLEKETGDNNRKRDSSSSKYLSPISWPRPAQNTALTWVPCVQLGVACPKKSQ
jgi:hypothetical protein